MLSIIKKIKFNNCLPLLKQKKFISISKNVEQINSSILKKQNGNFLGKNQQKNLIKTIWTRTGLNHPISLDKFSLKDDARQFMSVFPDVIRDLTEMTSKYDLKDSKEASKRIAKILEYNLPKGKKTRGLTIVLTYKLLVDKNELTPENLRLAYYLGWCVEMIQSRSLIVDDVMDSSLTRRGQPCWYKLKNVGLAAINDGMILENSIYCILRKYFNQKPYYTGLLECLPDIFFIITIGQSLDLQTGNKNVMDFTMERYKTIAVHKTAYLFYMPFMLAMLISGFTDQIAIREAKTILLEMGEFFQIQDDFIDCFGDPVVTGKLGTDIKENKCTWLAAICMQRANEQQKHIMQECYGKNDCEKIAKVKELYTELGLPETYDQFEKDSYNLMKTRIEQSSKRLPHEILYKILDKIYQKNS